MAKSQYSVKMDYKNATRAARDLDDIVYKLERQRDKLNDCVPSINSWQSEASGSYKDKIRQQADKLNNMIMLIRQTADLVRTVSKNTYNADMEAIRLANSGGGGNFSSGGGFGGGSGGSGGR